MAIAVGKAACANARPTSAGLKTLNPRPPKRPLPSAMATRPATAPIQSGKPGGSVSASRSPVMTAEKSPSRPDCVPVATSQRSAARHAPVTTAIEASAESPYWKTQNAHTGTSDHTTCRMILSTLRSPCTWGAGRISTVPT